MKNRIVFKILLRAAPAVLVVAALATATAPAAAQVPQVGDYANPLFIDNFYSPTLTVDANTNYSDPLRQSGTNRYQTYIGYLGNDPNDPSQTDGKNLFKGDVNTGYVYLGNSSLPVSGAEGTMAMTGIWSVFPWPLAVLDKNWNGNLSQNGMTIGFDVYSAGPYDVDVAIGGSPTVNGVMASDPDPTRFGIRLNADGSWNAYIDNSYVPVASGTMGGASIRNGWHHFDFVCSDPTDAGYDGSTNFGNPFDGVGTTQIDMYLDDASTPFGSYTQGNGGYADNYIGIGTLTHDYVGQTAYTMGDNYYTYFDNLSIYGTVSNQWKGDSTGNWSTASKWTSSTVPNAPGAAALFGSLNSESAVVTTDTSVTVGTINFDSLNSYTINGPGTITLNNTGGTGNAQITVDKGSHTIAANLNQSGELDLNVEKAADTLTLAGNVTANGFGWNVNSPEFSTILLTGSADPSYVTLNGGRLNVTGGSLTAAYSITCNLGSQLYLGTGGTVTTPYVYGDGVLSIVGGTLQDSSGNNPYLDIRILGIGNGSSYSLEAGESLSVCEIAGDAIDGTLTFNGGTLICRADGYFPYDFLGHTDLGWNLTGVYVDAPSTVDLNSQEFRIYQSLSGAGSLAVANSGFARIYNDSPDWSGGMSIDNYALLEVEGALSDALGTGPVNVSSGSTLVWSVTNEGATSFVVNNDITLNGPGSSAINPAVAALAYFNLSGDPSVVLSLAGTLTVHNDIVYGTPNIGTSPGTVLDLNGKITDVGGDVGGLILNGHVDYTGTIWISGSDSNDYQGDTSILNGEIHLAKEAGKVAIPSANVYLNQEVPVSSVDARLEGDQQINQDAVVTMYGDAAANLWTALTFNGHTQTIGGLQTDDSGMAFLQNSFFDAVAEDGKLIVNSSSADYFNGYIRDCPAWAPSTGRLALEKDGTGTLTLVGENTLTYTGLTAIQDGLLQINSTNTLAGGVSGPGNLGVGDASHVVALTLSGSVLDVGGTTTIGDGSTLYVNTADATLDTVEGGGGTLTVVTDGALTSSSITVGTLVIGGSLPTPAPTAVPEPSTLVLLALAGLAAAWLRLRKK